MRRVLALILLHLSLLSLLSAQPQKVYIGNIDGMIDLGLAPYIKRVISEAEKASADAVIFKINTFGGRVDAATQIKDAILNSKVQTVAFIDKRAISAGALISLSCDKIIMVPGASMGASTVVDEQGQKQSEKYQSYMRSEMRSTAERTGRRTDIAEAMVDESIVVEGLDDSTKLVTLTSSEAVKYGMADTILTSTDEVLNSLGLKNANIENIESNWAEDVVRFINNPLVSSILIMIGLVGLFVEIKTPGWGLPGTAALVALALFFGAGYILDLASAIEIIIFVAGVILLIVEIFVIPGFGVAGIIGILCIMAGLFLSLISEFPLIESGSLTLAIVQLAASLLSGLVLILLLLKYLPKSKTFDHLILHQETAQSEGFTSNPELIELEGTQGISLTVLRPAGLAEINGRRIDVITEGDYIEQGRKISVVRVEGSKVVVREL